MKKQMCALRAQTTKLVSALTQPVNENADLRPIPASQGRAAHWPARRMVVIHHVGASSQPVTLKIPLSWYQGIAADVRVSDQGVIEKVQIILAHRDGGLEVVLHEAEDDLSLIAEWGKWSRAMGLPMLVRTLDGDVPTTTRLGGLDIQPVAPRRAPRSFLHRRTRFLRRRKVGVA